MLLLLFSPPAGQAQPEFINFASVVGDLIPALNAETSADLIFWSTGELYQWIDDAAQRLARTCGVFVVRDTSLSSVLGQGPYSLPARHVATIQADLAGFVLRPANVQELEALDESWPSTGGMPRRFVQNTQGLLTIVLYPAPDADSAAKSIGLVLRVFPSTIGPFNAYLAAPTCLRDYFTFYALGEARAKESKAAMPEVAGFCRQMTGLYEQVITSYWGVAQ